MPDSLRTTISQFSSSGGRWQARAANARAVEPAADLPGAQRGSLYMLIEANGSGGGHVALYRQMLNAAQAAFYEKGDTVEAALRQAVRSAHTVLRQANEGLPEAGWRAGISLVVRYANRLTIGQAGPALVLVSHPKTVDQFPAELGERGEPLGGDVRPDVRIYDATIEAGSMVLLAQSDWPQYVVPEALAVAAAAPNVNLATQYLGQLAGTAELSALLVGFSSTIPELQEEPAARPTSRPGISHPPPEAGMGPAGVDQGPGRGPRPDGRLFGPGKPAEEFASPQAGSTLAPPPVATPVKLSRRAEPVAVAKLEPVPRMELPRSLDEEAAEPAAEQPVIGPIDESDEGRGRSFWPIIALGVIPLLIIGIVAAMLLVRNNATNAEFDQLLQGATSVITEVKALPDDAMAAQRLNAARDFLDKARTLRPDDQRLASLEQEYQALFDKVQHVTPLYGIVPLWTFKEAGHSAAQVLANGDSLFVLDTGRNQVDRFTRSQLGDTATPADKPIVRKGDQISGTVVSDLLDIAWVEAAGPNQRSKLLTLDTSGGLVSYDSTWGVDRTALGGRDKLKQPQLTTGYGGNLYIVDPGANQIWRYRPGSRGYEGDPESYFAAGKQPDLTGVQAIAIDGNVWLLYTDGRLLKFFAGEQRPFDFQGLPTKLSMPVALAVPLEGDRIYILDAGNGRIVEVTKDGTFLRQFHPREGDFLRDARSFFLDEANSKFYIVTADQLYAADVPASSAPATGVSVAPASTPTPAQ